MIDKHSQMQLQLKSTNKQHTQQITTDTEYIAKQRPEEEHIAYENEKHNHWTRLTKAMS